MSDAAAIAKLIAAVNAVMRADAEVLNNVGKCHTPEWSAGLLARRDALESLYATAEAVNVGR